MTEYELQQLQLSQQTIDKLTLHQSEMVNLHSTVSQSVYNTDVLINQQKDILAHLSHLSDQNDLMHQTIYSIGLYVTSLTVSVILCAALLMFLVGYKVSRGR